MIVPLVSGTLLSESAARTRAGPLTPDARRAKAFSVFKRWWAATAAVHGPASSPRALWEGAGAGLLRLLGFAPLPVSLRSTKDHVAVVARTRRGTHLAVVATSWNAHPNEHWRGAVVAGTSLGTPWCLVFDGATLGVVDAARPFARRHASVSLAGAAGDEGSFDVLWSALRAECFDATPDGCAFQRLVHRTESDRALACAALDRGVREAFDHLRGALAAAARRSGTTSSPPLPEQALTLVFRLLFLLYAESRRLLPVDHPIYRDGYSLLTLGRGDGHVLRGALWPAVRALMRIAHAGCRVRDLDVTAFNGRLFAPDRVPLAEHARLDDAPVGAALAALTTRKSGGRRIAVPYGELGVEQLGAIYERLIDEQPPAGDGEARAVRASARKATGTFYTPAALTHFLVRRTLAPLVEGASPDEILDLRVVDPAMGSGAFLVAACQYLASVYERALVGCGAVRPGDVGEADRAGFRRMVAQRCLYGVDNNPMAVQLARLSIWLTTLAGDRPLSFLDHRLRVGDSLVGAGFDDLGRRAAGGPRRKPAEGLPLLASLDPSQALRHEVTARLAFAATADDTATTVKEKEQAFARLHGPEGPLRRWRLAADAWCAAWFWPEPAPPPPQVVSDLVIGALREAGGLRAAQRDRLMASVREAARRLSFFHWTFEFPEVFTGADGFPRPNGGFDAVLGNPPWDMVRAEDGTSRQAARQLAIFSRDSGLYSSAHQAHVNRYQLFVERSLDLLRDGGRLGLIVPWGLFGDTGSARVRRRLFEHAEVDAVVVFDNRRAMFPIHRSVRFLACCATKGRATRAIACRIGETDARSLESIPDLGADGRNFPVTLTVDAMRVLGGELAPVPAVRDAASLALLLRLSERYLPVSDPRGWGARFGRELNATDDRGDFSRRDPGARTSLPRLALPVVEGKHLSPFRIDLGMVTWVWPREKASSRQARRFGRARLAFRDVAGPGNRLTLIAAMLPADTVSTHTVCCLEGELEEVAQHVLCALLNSLVANWYVRLWVNTHVTSGLVERLPVPWLRPEDPAHERLLELSRLCSREGIDGEAWIALQAECARAYALAGDELSLVLETFPLIARETRDAIARRFDAQ